MREYNDSPKLPRRAQFALQPRILYRDPHMQFFSATDFPLILHFNPSPIAVRGRLHRSTDAPPVSRSME